MAVTIGVSVNPQNCELAGMRDAWMKVEELGADAIYSADHFHGQILDEEQANRSTQDDGEYGKLTPGGTCFEGTTIQAAMAVTTTRIKVGCICHAIGFRNPNLMADIARTIDHLSGGRFILGMGTGYLKADYDEYGYEFGTQTSRSLDMARDIPIIKDRLGKLNPPPIGKVPLLMATMGEKIGMRVAAEYADIWHLYGPIEKIRAKIAVMRKLCDEVGRDFSELELMTYWWPHIQGNDDTPDMYLAEGIKNILVVINGPDWDMGQLREILAWRDALPADV